MSTSSRRYTQLWNGVSVEATDQDAAALATASNVVAVYPVLEVEQPTSPAPHACRTWSRR